MSVLEIFLSDFTSVKVKNSKNPVISVRNKDKLRSDGKSQKNKATSVHKESYRYSKYKRGSSTSSVEGSPEQKRPNERYSRRPNRSTKSQSSKSLNTRKVALKQDGSKAGKSNTVNVIGKRKTVFPIAITKPYGVGQKHPGKSIRHRVHFKTVRMKPGKNVKSIKTTSARRRIYKRKLGKGKNSLKVKLGSHDSKSSARIPISSLVKDEDVHELPCGESGKWKYIRMYQERARRREARKRRQRQKEREGASGKKSTRRRKKSRKRSKSKRSRSRSKRRKSSSRRSRSKSRKSSSRRSSKPRRRRRKSS